MKYSARLNKRQARHDLHSWKQIRSRNQAVASCTLARQQKHRNECIGYQRNNVKV